MADIFDEMWEAQIDLQEAQDNIQLFELEAQLLLYVGTPFTESDIRTMQHEKGLLENRAFDAERKLDRLGEQYDQMIYEDEIERMEA